VNAPTNRDKTEIRENCVACGGRCALFCHLPKRISHSWGFEASEIDYIQCETCGTIQQYPMPSAEDLEARVAKEYSSTEDRMDFEREVTDATRPQHLKFVEQLRERSVSGRVLEVGTGVGNLLDIVRSNGIDATGIDLSPELVGQARKRGLPVEERDIKSVERRNLSAVLMSHVFEHLSAPDETLQEVREITSSSGLFISAQPTAMMTNLLSRLLRLNRLDAESRLGLAYLNLHPWHIVIYSVKGMRAIARKNGFEVVGVLPMPSLQSKGAIGVVRKIYGALNAVGEALFPERWPLHVAHMFILRKAA
jgi:2-polyprenyl-3-methyl-5-hydroxy-6-metoxy-1,4-benzoquinol methylase